MADVKISGLPASTVPLAGTEVLPIVQGGATKQVSIANVTAGRAVSALSVTTDTNKAASSAGGTLQSNNGTACLQWGAGGGSNVILDGGVSLTAANVAVTLSPTGTGTVAISPAGALTINPTAASTINNTSIGVTTAAAGGFTTVKAATTIGVGAATPAASGAGITFPATQSASSDANTLDDYEEGTFIPTATAGTPGVTPPTFAYSCQYTKIGRQVLVTGYIAISTAGTASGNIDISGFPFINGNTGFAQIGIANEQALTNLLCQIRINANNTTGSISATGGGGVVWVNGGLYVFSMTYYTNS